MAKIMCTQAEYDKLSTVLEDNPQFLADVHITYDVVEKASAGLEYQVKGSGLYLLISGKSAYQINTRVINVKEIVDSMLDYFGLDTQGKRIHEPKGWKYYAVLDVSINQAKSIKRWIDTLMKPHDLYCEMKYDKNTRCASYAIVS